MGLLANVVAKQKISSAWGNAIRDRTVQQFSNMSDLQSNWASAPVGALAVTTDNYRIWQKQGPAGSDWVMIGFPNKRTAHIFPTVNHSNTNTSPVDIIFNAPDANPTLTFTKYSATTRLSLSLKLSGFVNGGVGAADFYITHIGVTDYKVINAFYNVLNVHAGWAGQIEVSGLAAGSYSFETKVAVQSGVTFNCDSNDTVSMTIEEVA